MIISEDLQERIGVSVRKYNAAVVALVCRGEARAPVFEVYIDNEQGVTLDLCREVSRDLQTVLDREIPGSRYRLVVSSPGLDRPLTYPWQYRKHTGKVLDLTLSPRKGEKLIARLVSVSDIGVVVELVSGKEHRNLSFEEILSATVRPPW